MKPIFILVLLVICVPLRAAEPARKCWVCQQPITGQFYLIGSPAVREKVSVCNACSRLDTRCFSCGLPVKTNSTRLPDGRRLCEADAKTGVFNATEAQRIFEETKRDLFRLLHGFGVLPDRNITVELVDGPQMLKLHRAKQSWHDTQTTMGLTRTRSTADRSSFEHTIYLLDGLGPARLTAVCAHEYGHAWLNENVPAGRLIDSDTVEGFCELLAWKLMTGRNDEAEKKVILANTYTHGQINTLLKAEDDHQFFRVLEWMKSGTDQKLDESNVARILALKEAPPPALVWSPQAKTAVPDTLRLRGISGGATRRFALVNDRTLEKNERAKVRVGPSNVVVRCLDITDKSVVLAIDGSEGRTELFLPPARP